MIRPTIKSKLEREGWTGQEGRKKLRPLQPFVGVIRDRDEMISGVPLFEYIGPPEKEQEMFRSGTVPWDLEREAFIDDAIVFIDCSRGSSVCLSYLEGYMYLAFMFAWLYVSSL